MPPTHHAHNPPPPPHNVEVNALFRISCMSLFPLAFFQVFALSCGN